MRGMRFLAKSLELALDSQVGGFRLSCRIHRMLGSDAAAACLGSWLQLRRPHEFTLEKDAALPPGRYPPHSQQSVHSTPWRGEQSALGIGER